MEYTNKNRLDDLGFDLKRIDDFVGEDTIVEEAMKHDSLYLLVQTESKWKLILAFCHEISYGSNTFETSIGVAAEGTAEEVLREVIKSYGKE